MSDTLIDPSKPPHALVETREDGSALRNDRVELKSANANRWYVLATLHGEQTGNEVDWDLHEKNRRYWNAWACSNMTRGERAAAAERLGLQDFELGPVKPEIANDRTIERAFKRRQGKGARLPDPSDPIDLENTHFSEMFVMEKCIFSGEALFKHATFSGPARLEAAVFSEDARFYYATFGSPAWFTSATFSGTADFDCATFSAVAHFDSAVFSADARFQHAKFSFDAWFDTATFSEIALFNHATFGWGALFGSATFSADAWFGLATFRSDADFSDGFFAAATTFEGTKFAAVVPEFYQRAMHQNTVFTVKEEFWPKITTYNSDSGKQAYTRLRQLMNQLEKPDDAHFFFRQEMRCKAELEEGLDWLVNRIFALFSDYGHSVKRPLWSLAALFLLGVAANWGYFTSGVALPEGVADSRLGSAIGLSFGSLFGFLGFNRVFFVDLLGDLPDVLKALSGFQTVFGFILLFFLGLGLRNHFRLK